MAIRMQVFGVEVVVDTAAEAVDVIRGVSQEQLRVSGRTEVQVIHQLKSDECARLNACKEGRERRTDGRTEQDAIQRPVKAERVKAPVTVPDAAPSPSPGLRTRIVAALDARPLGMKGLADAFGIPKGQVIRETRAMEAEGLIVSTGQRGTQRWHLVSGPPAKEAHRRGSGPEESVE